MDKSRANQPSYLALISGIYEISLQGFKKVNLMVMRNSIHLSSNQNKILFKFDLKGSKYNRMSIPKGLSKRDWKKMARTTVLKDLDLT